MATEIRYHQMSIMRQKGQDWLFVQPYLALEILKGPNLGSTSISYSVQMQQNLLCTGDSFKMAPTNNRCPFPTQCTASTSTSPWININSLVARIGPFAKLENNVFLWLYKGDMQVTIQL